MSSGARPIEGSRKAGGRAVGGDVTGRDAYIGRGRGPDGRFEGVDEMRVEPVLVRVGQEATPAEARPFRLQVLDEVQVGEVDDAELAGHVASYPIASGAVPVLGGTSSDTSVQGTLSGALRGKSVATSRLIT